MYIIVVLFICVNMVHDARRYAVHRVRTKRQLKIKNFKTIRSYLEVNLYVTYVLYFSSTRIIIVHGEWVLRGSRLLINSSKWV